MTKDDVLNLQENQETVDKLFRFTETSLLNDEVLFASFRLAEILYSDYQYEEAIKVLINKLHYYEHQKENNLYYNMISLIVDSYLKLEDKINASKYIELKKEALPLLKYDIYYKDILRFKKLFKEDFFPVLSIIDQYNTTRNDIVSYYLEYFNFLISEQDEKVESYYFYLLNLNLEKKYHEEIKGLYYDYLLKGNFYDLLKEVIKDEQEVIQSYYLTLMILQEETLFKVQIFEAEHQNNFKLLDLHRQEKLYGALKAFYKDKDNLGYELYSKNHSSALRKLKNIIKEEQIEYKSVYTIPKKVKKRPIEVEPERTEAVITQDKNLQILDKIMLESLSMKTDVTLIERIRSFFKILENHLIFSDIIFNYNGKVYHYKKERLYEKQYDKYTLDASILGITANEYIDIIESVDKIKYNYDILTNKPLTDTKVKQVYCYGLIENSSICFYQTRQKGIHLDQEIFKALTNVISYEMQYFNKLQQSIQKHQMLESFFNNKEMMQFIYKDKMIGNKAFDQTFKLNKGDDHDTLISKFLPIEQQKYIELTQKLRRREIRSFDIELTYNNKIYLATHYINRTYLCGLFADITDYKTEQDRWREKAFINPKTNVLTMHEFEVSFKDYINNKTTFILIELEDLLRIESLYGKQTKRRYFLEFTALVKKQFDTVYEFDQNTLLAVVDKNDIRAIEKEIDAFYNLLKTFKSKVLDLQQPNVYMGIIRYPIQTKETNIDKIYQYLSLSLFKSKMNKDYKKIHYFNFDDYQQDLFETEVLRQIDRLIVDQNLNLTFNQIINPETNKVYAYEVGIQSSSLAVFESYYFQVAKRRGMLARLEKFIIEQTFIRLKELYDSVNNYIKVIIKISKETLTEPNFTNYIVSLFKQYQMPLSVVEFIYDTNTFVQAEAVILKALAEYGIKIGVNQVEYLYMPFVKTFHFTKRVNIFDLKTQSFIKMIQSYCAENEMDLIFYHVDQEEEKNQLQTLQVDFIRGKLFDKAFSFNELLELISKTLKSN